MATVRIPVLLRRYTDGQKDVPVSGNTAGEALNDLTEQYPELRDYLFDGDELRSYVNIFIGKDDLRTLGGASAPIEEDTVLRIIPSISGG